MHNLSLMFGTVVEGLGSHLSQWDGWAVVIAAALFGLQRGPLWMPVVVGLIINPMPYALVAGLLHGRHVGLESSLIFTGLQLVLSYCGYGLGRVAARFR